MKKVKINLPLYQQQHNPTLKKHYQPELQKILSVRDFIFNFFLADDFLMYRPKGFNPNTPSSVPSSTQEFSVLHSLILKHNFRMKNTREDFKNIFIRKHNNVNLLQHLHK
jgi:hypothetical protein